MCADFEPMCLNSSLSMLSEDVTCATCIQEAKSGNLSWKSVSTIEGYKLQVLIILEPVGPIVELLWGQGYRIIKRKPSLIIIFPKQAFILFRPNIGI